MLILLIFLVFFYFPFFGIYFFGWLGLPKSKNHDAHNSSLSSDDELFQECENGLDATTIVPNIASVRAHSSNIDHNVFDKTINFSSIEPNSTAGLVVPISELSQQDNPVANLNETVVVDNTLPSVNTSYVVSPEVAETLSSENGAVQIPNEHRDDPIEVPTMSHIEPSSTLPDLNSKAQNFEISNDDSQTLGREFYFFLF